MMGMMWGFGVWLLFVCCGRWRWSLIAQWNEQQSKIDYEKEFADLDLGDIDDDLVSFQMK